MDHAETASVKRKTRRAAGLDNMETIIQGVERWMRTAMFWATFLTMWWKNMRIPCTLGGAFMQVFSWQYTDYARGSRGLLQQ